MNAYSTPWFTSEVRKLVDLQRACIYGPAPAHFAHVVAWMEHRINAEYPFQTHGETFALAAA